FVLSQDQTLRGNKTEIMPSRLAPTRHGSFARNCSPNPRQHLTRTRGLAGLSKSRALFSFQRARTIMRLFRAEEADGESSRAPKGCQTFFARFGPGRSSPLRHSTRRASAAQPYRRKTLA